MSHRCLPLACVHARLSCRQRLARARAALHPQALAAVSSYAYLRNTHSFPAFSHSRCQAWHGPAGVREHGALHLYSLMGGSDVAEVPGADVLFRGVALRGWWLTVWLASLSKQQLHAALQARGHAHVPRHGHHAGPVGSNVPGPVHYMSSCSTASICALEHGTRQP